MRISRLAMMLGTMFSAAGMQAAQQVEMPASMLPAGAGKNEARYRRATGHTVAMGKRAAIKARNRQRNKAAHRGRRV